MTTHYLKTVEPYFSAVSSGEKTFEVRRNDRAYQKGDTLVLFDWDACECTDPDCKKRRPSVIKQVSFVFAGSPDLRDLGGVVPGYVVLGLTDLLDGSMSADGCPFQDRYGVLCCDPFPQSTCECGCHTAHANGNPQ